MIGPTFARRFLTGAIQFSLRSGRRYGVSCCPARILTGTWWSRPSSHRSTSSTASPRKQKRRPAMCRLPVQSCSPGRTRPPLASVLAAHFGPPRSLARATTRCASAHPTILPLVERAKRASWRAFGADRAALVRFESGLEMKKEIRPEGRISFLLPLLDELRTYCYEHQIEEVPAALMVL
jgi:hypothetical protein